MQIRQLSALLAALSFPGSGPEPFERRRPGRSCNGRLPLQILKLPARGDLFIARLYRLPVAHMRVNGRHVLRVGRREEQRPGCRWAAPPACAPS
eukprot:361518-Chlamydomonas_euryale.AAC.1